MPVPDSKTIVTPLLKFLKDGKEHSMKEIENHLALQFKLSDEEKNLKKQSGHETLFHNRVHWAKFYLKQKGLINNPRRSFTQITNDGLRALKQKPKI